MRIAVLGSCVTRDMIQFLPRDVELVLYVARTSFVSLIADPFPVNEEEILVEHAFNRRVVFWDMTKAFWDKLEKAKPDALLIDFIDERFDLWKKGNQVITRSNYLAMSNIEKERLEGFELLRRDSPKTHELWERSCEAVITRIKQCCSDIVLHRALWAESCYVGDEVMTFDEMNRAIAIRANEWLSIYYDRFIALCPDAKEIRVPEELRVSNFAHKWGRDFFHYGDAYYKKLAEMVVAGIDGASSSQRRAEVK